MEGRAQQKKKLKSLTPTEGTDQGSQTETEQNTLVRCWAFCYWYYQEISCRKLLKALVGIQIQMQ